MEKDKFENYGNGVFVYRDANVDDKVNIFASELSKFIYQRDVHVLSVTYIPFDKVIVVVDPYIGNVK